MGIDNSTIAEEVAMTPSEVAWLHDRYDLLRSRAVAPSDHRPLDEVQWCSKFPESHQTLARTLFHAMDPEGKGVVDFRHFCVGVSVLQKGGVDDQIAFVFRLYDESGKGFIDLDDMVRMVEAFQLPVMTTLLTLVDPETPQDQTGAASDPRQIARTLMKNMDSTGSNCVSLNDFRAFCEVHKSALGKLVDSAFTALRRAAFFDWDISTSKS